jgi:hypothetical protein
MRRAPGAPFTGVCRPKRLDVEALEAKQGVAEERGAGPRQAGAAAAGGAHGRRPRPEFSTCWPCSGGTRASRGSTARPKWSRVAGRMEGDANLADNRRNSRWAAIRYAGARGQRRAGRVDIRKLYGRRECSPTIPASPRPPAAKARSPISTARKACCSTAAIRSTSWPSIRASWKSAYLLLNGELPSKDELDEVHLHDHPPHHAARAADAVLPRLPPRRAPDGDHVRRGRRALGLLSRQHRHFRSRAPHDRSTG